MKVSNDQDDKQIITEESDNSDSVKEELEETKTKYLRALADYQNLEKQTQVWKTDFVVFANEKLIKKLLEVLDDLERAEQELKSEGLTLITAKFKKVLADEGLTELQLEDKEYDPITSEVVSVEPGEEENIIKKVLQKGYMLGEKVIRPAKVIVSSKQKI